MYRVFSFSAIYRVRNGRRRTPADMLECIRCHTGNRSYLLVNFWGEYNNLHDTMECVKNDIPSNHYNHWITEETYKYTEYLYEAVIIYEDARPILIYDRGNY